MATAQQGPTPEFALGMREMMLDGIAREVEIAKKVLAAVPDDKADYRPDPHARTARELALHIANVDVWFLNSIADSKFGEESEHKPQTTAELVEWYDQNMKRGIERVRALSAQQLSAPLDFMGAFNLPAVAYLGFLNNHSIHHRGELATYLRPMGSKCPSIYGGSYDEPWQAAQAQDETAA